MPPLPPKLLILGTVKQAGSSARVQVGTVWSDAGQGHHGRPAVALGTKAVDSKMKSLERENIGKMFMFWYSFCKDSQVSMWQVHQGIEHCHAPLAQAQLKKFQDCLAHMHCNDKAKDSIDAGNRELQLKWQLETCVTKCVDDHTHLIPTRTEKMRKSLFSIGKLKSL